MAGLKTAQINAGGARRPEDLRLKYRKLAIPAVVAAVMAKKKKPRDRAEPRKDLRKAEADRR
ncbi:MAG TPA: hypothetical protein VGA77_15705 [Propylenella sp.]